MARKKEPIRVIEDFAGIDYYSSDLTRTENAFKSLQNFQFGEGAEIVGRKGFQACGQKGGFIGGHVYTYLNTTSGATEEEILAANDHLWRLTSSSFTIAYSGGGTWYYRMQQSGSAFALQITDSASAGAVIALGDGASDTPYTVADLFAAIDALAGFSCAWAAGVEFAKVNGAQAGVSVITVDAGHTYAVGDIITLYDHATSRLTQRILTATAATTLTFNAAFGVVTVADNQDIGPTAVPAAAGLRQITLTDDMGASEAVPFMYWEPVKFNYIASIATAPFEFGAQATNGTVSLVNANDVCYAGQTKRTVGDDVQSETDPDGKILKYDGNRIYRAGMIEGGFSSFTPGAGSATYRYIVTREQTDHRGNIVEGDPSPISTQENAALNTTCVLTNIQTSGNAGWFNTAAAIVDGNQSSGSTITVDAGHTLRAGDTVSIYDSVTGGIVRRTLTSVTATTLVWAATTSITVIDTMAVSCGLVNKIWRTKDRGVDFYFVIEIPNNPFSGTSTVTDSVADASLAIKYEFPLSGEEHDPPPAANFLCMHQGALIGAGDRQQPNTIIRSMPGYLEYFPASTSSLDIPSSVLGSITAIGSDSDNRLAVFKPNAYYDIEGDLETGALNVRTVHERDYGVISHQSLVRIKDELVGVGALGVVAVKNGELSAVKGLPVRPAFTQAPAAGNITSVVCANDHRNLMLRVYVESEDDVVPAFVADYEETPGSDIFTWFDWAYAAAVAPVNGVLVSSRDLYNIGSAQFFKELNLTTDDTAFPYVLNHSDNAADIEYVMRTTGFHRGSPRQDKRFQTLTLFNYAPLIDPLSIDSSFPLTIKTYRNRSATPHTNTTKTLGGNDLDELTVDLKDGKARMMTFEVICNTTFQSPRFNGFEIWVTRDHPDDEIAE